MPGNRKSGKIQSNRKVCVDTGGTFTDLISFDRGRVRITKLLSTPEQPDVAVLDGLRELGGPAPGGRLIHGNTVGLNAILTGRGAKIALVTNKGFEDLCEIARQDRPELYSLTVPPRPVLVERKLRFGISERRNADGRLQKRASRKELNELRERIRRSKANAIAVCLLHSYAHPQDEERIALALAPLGLPISLSAGLVRRHREYERFSTTLMNAFIQPVVSSYLNRLADAAAPMQLMLLRNEGGCMPLAEVLEQPVRTLLSGPAGGVLGARAWAKLCGFERAIGFDMGGTSADVALCAGDGDVEEQALFGGHSLALPSVPVASIGCGGGSIAFKDAGSALRVGPESAGADPGPACYGKGMLPTVTDAHLFLGRLPTWGLLGGSFALHPERSAKAIAKLAAALGLSSRRLAKGILDVADLQMARPIRKYSLGRGLDPAELALVAFGGAGGLHAVRLADLVGFRTVIVPPFPGLLSAVGMLMAQPVFEREVAYVRELSRRPDDELEARAVALLEETKTAADLPATEARTWAAVRYRGNNAEFWVPARRTAARLFEQEFEKRYGFRQELPIEILRLRARLSFERKPGKSLFNALGKTAMAVKNSSHTDERRLTKGGLFWRTRDEVPTVESGKSLKGPVAILDYSGTTVVENAWQVRLHESAALILTRA